MTLPPFLESCRHKTLKRSVMPEVPLPSSKKMMSICCTLSFTPLAALSPHWLHRPCPLFSTFGFALTPSAPSQSALTPKESSIHAACPLGPSSSPSQGSHGVFLSYGFCFLTSPSLLCHWDAFTAPLPECPELLGQPLSALLLLTYRLESECVSSLRPSSVPRKPPYVYAWWPHRS